MSHTLDVYDGETVVARLLLPSPHSAPAADALVAAARVFARAAAEAGMSGSAVIFFEDARQRPADGTGDESSRTVHYYYSADGRLELDSPPKPPDADPPHHVGSQSPQD